jgi:hypothetical protein
VKDCREPEGASRVALGPVFRLWLLNVPSTPHLSLSPGQLRLVDFWGTMSFQLVSVPAPLPHSAPDAHRKCSGPSLPTCRGGSELSHLGAVERDGHTCPGRKAAPPGLLCAIFPALLLPSQHIPRMSGLSQPPPLPYFFPFHITCVFQLLTQECISRTWATVPPTVNNAHFPTRTGPGLPPRGQPAAPCQSPNTPVYLWASAQDGVAPDS